MKFPLSGQTVLVTRPISQAEPLKSLLLEAGATVFLQPTIEISPPDSWDVVDSAILNINNYDWVVFSSSNGARFFIERVNFWQKNNFCDIYSGKIAAVGPGTAKTLDESGIREIHIPKTYTAEGVVELLAPSAAQKQRFLSVRASRGRDILVEQLTLLGGNVEEIVVYNSVDLERPDQIIVELMQHSQLHWVTVTSSSIAGSLFRMFRNSLYNTKIMSVGPITTQTLLGLGVPPFAEADTPTMEGIYEKLLFLCKNADG